MKELYQPVFEYMKTGFWQHFYYQSTIVYDTEERARLCAPGDWKDIMSEDDKLIDITFKTLFLG